MLTFSCSTEEKPCEPGCVDARTRLECDASGAAKAVPCPAPAEACAAAVCTAGACSVEPAVGAPCGPTGDAQCNEGYACIGPDVRLSAILQHTCAVADDGKVWCWGGNWRGELGDGTTEDRLHPVLVRGLPGPARDVTAGYAHTCALLSEGEAYCWGDNTGGQTAPTTPENPVSRPRLVESPVRFVSLHAGQGHTCGLTPEGTVYCWGNTAAGQCGVDPAESILVGPTQIPALDHVVSLDTVKNHTCALRSREPTMVCWGSNQHLEQSGAPITQKLGPGTAELKFSAKPLSVGLDGVVDVGMGYESTYAVTEDGSVWGWGRNTAGQVGIGTIEPYVTSPVQVLLDSGQPLTGAIEAFRSDGSDQCALVHEKDDSQRYYCWGGDDHGELGFGEEYPMLQPFARATTVIPAGATSFVRGEDHACFVAEDGGRTAIWCLGKPTWVANDANAGGSRQIEPLPIQWAPANFPLDELQMDSED